MLNDVKQAFRLGSHRGWECAVAAIEWGCPIEQFRQLIDEQIVPRRETLADAMPPGHDIQPADAQVEAESEREHQE